MASGVGLAPSSTQRSSAASSVGQEIPDSQVYDNGFKIQWEHFIRHVVEDAPYKWTLPEGAKGVQLVEAALASWKERRWIDVPPLAV